MEIIQLSAHSFGRLSPLLLTAIVSVFLFIRKDKRSSDWLLGLYFFFLTLFNLGYFIAYSVTSSAGSAGWYFNAGCLFGLTALIQFSYRFPEHRWMRESKIILAITLTAAAAGFIDYIISAAAAPVVLSSSSWGSAYSSRIIPVTALIFYLWTIILFIRHMTAEEAGCSFRSKLKSILFPASKAAASARILALLVTLEFLNSAFIFSLMASPSITAERVILFSQNAFMLTIYTLYMLVYLGGSRESISFRYKMIGIPAIALIIAVTAVGDISLLQREDSYDEARISETKFAAASFLAGDAVPASVSYMLKKNGTAWTTIYADSCEFPAEPAVRIFSSLPSAKALAAPFDPALLQEHRENRRYFTQILGRNYFQYHYRFRNEVYAAGFSCDYYRHYIHKTAMILSLMLIATALGSLAVLPLLSQKGIFRPLNRAVGELKEMRNDSDRKEHPLDEIAYLSHAIDEILNESKIRAARKQLPPQITASVQEKLERILVYMRINYHDELSREGLAASVDLAPTYLGKMFKLYTGKKIAEMINSLRIAEAKHLLEEGRKSIIEIAFETGFESVRTFNRAFLKETGMQPSEYKRMTGHPPQTV